MTERQIGVPEADAAARRAEPLEVDVVDRPHGPQDRLLLLVHGYGESPAMFLPHLEAIDPEARYLVALPRAPFRHKDADIWHRALGPGKEEAPLQYLESLERLAALVPRVCEEHGIELGRTVVGGFSQGAGLAVGLTLRAGADWRPAGCLAFCGFLPPVPGFAVDPAAAAGTPLLLLTATRDDFVPLDSSRASADGARRLGLVTTYHELEMGHTITEESATLARPWLDRVWRGEPAAEPAPPVIEPNPFMDWLAELWV